MLLFLQYITCRLENNGEKGLEFTFGFDPCMHNCLQFLADKLMILRIKTEENFQQIVFFYNKKKNDWAVG